MCLMHHHSQPVPQLYILIEPMAASDCTRYFINMCFMLMQSTLGDDLAIVLIEQIRNAVFVQLFISYRIICSCFYVVISDVVCSELVPDSCDFASCTMYCELIHCLLRIPRCFAETHRCPLSHRRFTIDSFRRFPRYLAQFYGQSVVCLTATIFVEVHWYIASMSYTTSMDRTCEWLRTKYPLPTLKHGQTSMRVGKI